MNVGEAYRRGRLDFMGVELLVEPGTLVPRQETELLGRCALEALSGLEAPRVIDMCCGAGNLACVLAYRHAGARIWASDLTEECARLARRNAERLGLAGRVRVLRGDLFSALRGLGLEGTVDAVVCNPPYISGRRLQADRAHLLDLEPREAFDGGPYGLTIHQRVAREALPYLRPGGVLLMEIGAGQDRQVRALLERAHAYVGFRAWRDAAGDARVVAARRTDRAATEAPAGA